MLFDNAVSSLSYLKNAKKFFKELLTQSRLDVFVTAPFLDSYKLLLLNFSTTIIIDLQIFHYFSIENSLPENADYHFYLFVTVTLALMKRALSPGKT